MDRSITLDAVDLESSRFLVAVSGGTASLDAPVATGPGWDVARLVGHLGAIYSRVALVVARRKSDVAIAVDDRSGPVRATSGLPAARKLGGEDSNPQLQGQNLPCCRLHHPRIGRRHRNRRAV